MSEPLPKILFVDDEKNILRALLRVFMEEPYLILTASSGAEAIEVLKKEWPVSVILTDYRMPEMNGVELLRRVSDMFPFTVRIVLSGYADGESVEAAIKEGRVYKFLSKPWKDDELRSIVAQAVSFSPDEALSRGESL